ARSPTLRLPTSARGMSRCAGSASAGPGSSSRTDRPRGGHVERSGGQGSRSRRGVRGTLSGVAVLAIDTSAAVAVSLCGDDGALLAARRVDSQREHAELLAPMVRDVLAEAGLAPADLVAVVAGTGPAPFTGLRAGLVTARMIALAREVPLHGVSALDALAAQVLLADDAASGGDLAGAGRASEVLVVTDARRREVYAARFRVADGDVVTVAGPFVDKPD